MIDGVGKFVLHTGLEKGHLRMHVKSKGFFS